MVLAVWAYVTISEVFIRTATSLTASLFSRAAYNQATHHLILDIFRLKLEDWVACTLLRILRKATVLAEESPRQLTALAQRS